MRQGPSNRRARGRGGNSGRRSNIPNRNQTFDSNGPDVRIRGTAFQVNEKYQALARDASAGGDRIMAENYLQHAEHYHRIIAAINEAQSQSQQQQAEGRDGGHRHRDGGRDNGHRDNGHRDNAQREAGGRDGANRDGAAGRENGHHAERDGGAPAAQPAAKAADGESAVEFGKDPRQDDARDAESGLSNGEAVIEVVGSQPATEPEASEAKPASDGANGADAQADEAPRPKSRRRGPGRPRKSARSKESAASQPEANPDGD